MEGTGVGGGGGAPATCVFQRLRLVGKGLDGELAQLVPRAGLTSAQTDAVIPAGTPLPSRSRSLKAEFRASTRAPDCQFIQRLDGSRFNLYTKSLLL